VSQKLFVGGLSFSTSSDRLRELFSAAGTVQSATVVTDRETGRSRGFGFVEMETTEQAEQAMSRFNGQEVDGRTIKVEIAKPSDRSAGPRRDASDRRRAGGGRGPRW
jgi:RNA recognition motif-containing protein